MQLVCRYENTDGVIVVDYPDQSTVDMLPYPGCVLLRGQLDVDAKDENLSDVYPRVGPEPGLLGKPPTDTHPDHVELTEGDVPQTVVDSGGVEKPHPLRLRAGTPYKDRRRVAEMDTRPRRAPSQSEPGVLVSYASWACEISLARGVVVNDVRFKADPAGLQTVEARASRASRDPKFTVKAQSEKGEVVTLSAQDMIAVADAVSDFAHVRSDLAAEISGLVSSGQVKSFGDVDAIVGDPRS